MGLKNKRAKQLLLILQFIGLIITVNYVVQLFLILPGISTSYSDSRIKEINRHDEIDIIRDVATLIDSRLKSTSENSHRLEILTDYYVLSMLLILVGGLTITAKIKCKD